MKGRLLKVFLVLIVLSAGCFGQSYKSPCDFSKFKYSWMDHFMPNGVLAQAKPVYSEAAKAVNAKGTVHVDLIVDSKGNVRDACVVSGHPLLHASALKATWKTKFKPNFGLTLPQSKKRRFLKTEIFYKFAGI